MGEKKDNKKKNNKKNKKDEKKELIKLVSLLVFVLILCIILGFVAYTNYKTEDEENSKDIAYTELMAAISKGEIEKIEMTNQSNSLKVILKGEGEEKERTKNALVPSIQAFMEWVQDKVDKEGIEIELIQKDVNPLLKVSEGLFSMLPTILLLVMILMVFKMQGLGGDQGKVYGGEDGKLTDVTFNDIAGLDEEKSELVEIVDFLKSPKRYTEMGAKIPRGILLYGRPGTGKTLIAKAIAGEAGVPFISMSGSEFIEMFAGLGASRVRRLFERAKKLAPSIVFIDEIDAIGSRRTSNSGAETENNQTLNQLLVEMDGFDSNETVIVLAATNRPEMLDKALLRPGRFDRQVTIPAPDLLGREEILKLHAKGKKIAEDVDLKSIAGDTAGFTGAELANILNEAAIIATKNEHKVIEHEAGHAIVSKFLPTQEDVKEISIIPRGVAGGYTMYKTTEDKFYVSKTELLEKMVALMGGRAAEKVALNEISTGASNDIEVATGIARDMLTVYGMDDRIGPISLKVDDPYELQVFGEKVVDDIGNQIQLLVGHAYQEAQRILRDNMDILDEVARVLMEKEKISSEEFEEFFKR